MRQRSVLSCDPSGGDGLVDFGEGGGQEAGGGGQDALEVGDAGVELIHGGPGVELEEALIRLDEGAADGRLEGSRIPSKRYYRASSGPTP